MKLQYDAVVDAAYLTLADAQVVESEEVKPGVVIDFDAKGRVVGVEIRSLRKQLPEADTKRIQLEVA